ncbi:unnamed protein product [Victoria cruziana]
MSGSCRNFAVHIFLFIGSILRAPASAVSVGDFNKDFDITRAPDHVNTSADGRERSLRPDQAHIPHAQVFSLIFSKVDAVRRLDIIYSNLEDIHTRFFRLMWIAAE